MKYSQYIVKKRFKGKAICGNVNIPYGTVCDVVDNFIYHNGNMVCATTSKNAIDYFWGYDSVNPEIEIERQKLAHKLFDLAPKDETEKLLSARNPWRKYGQLLEFASGMFMWHWDSIIFDLPTERLQYLLNCVKKGVAPLCIE